MKTGLIVSLIYVGIFLALVFGEIRCIYKMCTCNWEPIGKAEIIYTVGTFTGAGMIIGYIEIKDK